MASPDESLQAPVDALRASLRIAGLAPGPAASLLPTADWTPSTQLHVAFGGKRVELGTFFRAGECKEVKPTVRFAAPSFFPSPIVVAGAAADAEDQRRRGRYTFLMIDPDAPTPDDPKFAFWRHWVVSGLVPGGGEDGTEVTEYLGPGPKDDSKPHRYLFLLYQESADMGPLSKADIGGDEFVQRRSFDAAAFAARHSLTLVGMNWMTCAGDGWTE